MKHIIIITLDNYYIVLVKFNELCDSQMSCFVEISDSSYCISGEFFMFVDIMFDHIAYSLTRNSTISCISDILTTDSKFMHVGLRQIQVHIVIFIKIQK